jgi:hypothetical protein
MLGKRVGRPEIGLQAILASSVGEPKVRWVNSNTFILQPPMPWHDIPTSLTVDACALFTNQTEELRVRDRIPMSALLFNFSARGVGEKC